MFIVNYYKTYCEISLISFKTSFINSSNLKLSRFNIFNNFLNLEFIKYFNKN